MKITRQGTGDHLELAIAGRLDASWAGRLSTELTELVRGGAHHLRLDLAEVDFMSSAGLRVLLQYYKQLKGLGGSLVVTDASAPVKTVMALAGFEELLGGKAQPVTPQRGTSVPEHSRVSLLERGAATFEVYERAAPASMTCRAIGDPDQRKRDSSAGQCRTMQFPGSAVAVGLGAFGHDFQDCRGRFGEFLAAAGAVAYHPTDGSDSPDYQLQSGAFLPDVQVLDCLLCEGDFRWLVRFEARPDAGTVVMAELVESCLTIARTDLAVLVMIVEATDLVGTALTASPVSDGGISVAGPAVRADLAHSVTLVAGLAARSDHPSLDTRLKPLGMRSWPTGFFHAATFPFRPLIKGEIELQPTVSALFEKGTLQQVLQLLSDERAGEAGPSRFVRGACWVGPISEVAVERTAS